MKQLEYVMSGAAYTRIPSRKAYTNHVIASYVNRIFSDLHTDKHEFSLLYNAFQEKGYGLPFSTVYRENITNVFADSGGLQMMSKNLQSTDAAKLEVYEHQAQFSTVAMCFDEIPVKRLNTDVNAKVSVMQNRVFDELMLVPCADATAKNIKTQIDHFLSVGSDAKVVLICHGNGVESMEMWLDTIMMQLTDKQRCQIDSIAIGSPALGSGTLQEVQKAIFFKTAKAKYGFDHLHLLGVGTYRRLLPYSLVLSEMIQAGEIRISYDSTSHAMNADQGMFVELNGDFMSGRMGRTFNPLYTHVYNMMLSYFPYIKDIIPDEQVFFDTMTLRETLIEEKYGTMLQKVVGFMAFNATSMTNFIRVAEKCFFDNDFIAEVCSREKNLKPLLHANNLNDAAEFKHYMNNVGKYLRSNAVPNKETSVKLELFW